MTSGMPDAIRPAKVKDQGCDEHGIAEECRKDHGAQHGTITFEIENVDDCGEGEAAAGKSHGEEFEADPESPRKIVGEIGGLAEAVGESIDQRVEAGNQDNHQDRFPEGELRYFHGHFVLIPISRGAELMRGALCCGNFYATVADPPDATEQHGAQCHDVRNVGQDSIGEQRHGFGGLVGAEAKLLEGDAGKQQYGSAADFVQTVDVVDVIAGIVLDALLSFGDQLVAFAKFGRAGGAGIRAGGLLALGHAVRTHVALADQWEGLAPLVLRNEEGASQHAVAATHAAAGLVSDRTGAVFWNAPTGHTETQLGSSQFMHSARMNLSSLVRTTVNLCSDCLDSAAMASL